MHSFLLLVLWAALGLTSSNIHQHHIETLMDNALVLRVPDSVGSMVEVPLTCGAAYQPHEVFWKKNGEELTPAVQGNHITVLVKEMKAGNYSCHLTSTGEYLNHTLILVQLDPDNRTVILEEKSPQEGHIHCSALNYNGSFHCNWKKTQQRSHATVLLIKASRYQEEISCVLDADGSGVLCQDVECPYKEEKHPIHLTIYMISHFRLEAYTKSFYLREIVRPEKLPNLHITSGQVFRWDYPDTWEKPQTYFGLHFQVKVLQSGQSCNSDNFILQNNLTEETVFDVNIKSKKYVFCVRAQDKHARGPWSHWSQCIVTKNNVDCHLR
ncbi:PREDICTED: interleukin-12 subunit beta-like isoform X1 [Cyprinodon variegatus]|uniref:interleukin-12 subunit beta-like isoform X1 n=1 Tax=Cyprinodon variegatus TaxID=28743 RepID=UPI00074275BA|nr:PREDICTED: interleukin-12 subunit beta-like isoform X1 [Cyprinodon variegatus]